MTWRRRAGLSLLAVVALATLAAAAVVRPAGFYHAYLAALLFWAGVPLGAAAVLMLHHLTGGRWGLCGRRHLEVATLTLPLVALAFLPLLGGLDRLYPWSDAGLVAAIPALEHRAVYLNVPFVAARAVGCYALWCAGGLALASRATRESARRTAGDEEGAARARPGALAAIGLVVYVLTVSVASTDWVMALEARWYSTVFAPYVIAGQALSALAFVVLGASIAALRTADGGARDALQDLASLLLTLVVFHGYLAFSQWLITWSGNKPAEVAFFLSRLDGRWAWFAGALGVVHFAVPVVALLFRPVKRSPRALAALSVALLLAQAGEDAWLVLPAGGGGGLERALLTPLTLLALGTLGWLAFTGGAALRDRWASSPEVAS